MSIDSLTLSTSYSKSSHGRKAATGYSSSEQPWSPLLSAMVPTVTAQFPLPHSVHLLKRNSSAFRSCHLGSPLPRKAKYETAWGRSLRPLALKEPSITGKTSRAQLSTTSAPSSPHPRSVLLCGAHSPPCSSPCPLLSRPALSRALLGGPSFPVLLPLLRFHSSRPVSPVGWRRSVPGR